MPPIHEPPSRQHLFWLRTAPHPSTPTATKYANCYLHHHGGGVDAIMMPKTPIYLRSHLSEDGQVVFTSWKHPGRSWCLDFALGGLDTEGASSRTKMRWHEAEIVETTDDDRDGPTLASTKGFVFDETMVSGELAMVLNAGDIAIGREGEWPQFGGWMVCEWKWGHPQLFFLLRKNKGEGEGEGLKDDVELPPFCERVVLVKEDLPEGVQDQAPENRV